MPTTGDLRPEGTLGRASDREVVLTRYLRAKLMEFNPGLPEDAYDDAVRQIVRIQRRADPARHQPRKVRPAQGRRAGYLPQRQGRTGQATAAGLRFRRAGEQPFPLRARAVGARRPLPPAGRHHRFRQRPAAALHGAARTSTRTSAPPTRRTSPTTRTPSRICFTTTPSLCLANGDRGQDRLDLQPVRAFPRMEAPGRRRAGRGGHGNAAQGHLRQAQLHGPGRELHRLR